MKKLANLIPIVTFLVGTLLGSGSIWKFLEYERSKEDHEQSKTANYIARMKYKNDARDLQIRDLGLLSAKIEEYRDVDVCNPQTNHVRNRLRREIETIRQRLADAEHEIARLFPDYKIELAYETQLLLPPCNAMVGKGTFK